MSVKRRVILGALLLLAGAILLALSIYLRHSPNGRWCLLGAMACIAFANFLNVIGSTKPTGKQEGFSLGAGYRFF